MKALSFLALAVASFTLVSCADFIKMVNQRPLPQSATAQNEEVPKLNFEPFKEPNLNTNLDLALPPNQLPPNPLTIGE
jgi:hypothetical protein